MAKKWKDFKMKKKTIISIIIGILLLFLFLFMLSSVGKLRIDLKNYGHGDYSKGSISSFLTALSISDNYDFVDEDGTGYCFESTCWEEADDEYDECCDSEEIIPMGIFLIGGPMIEDECPEECDEQYHTKLMDECVVECNEEVYMWDRSPIDNMGEWARHAYPNFMYKSETFCNSWLIGGTWTETSDKVGCEDAWLIFCGTRSLTSAKNVCETIGKEWTCDWSQAICN